MALKQFTINGWVAADQSGEVHFFFVKPLRGQTRWLTTQHNVEVEFPNIKWEDEPQEALSVVPMTIKMQIIKFCV